MSVRVTGLGSLPGADAGAAVRLAFDVAPDLPWLPELPARGPWAGLIGRTAGLLSGLGVEYLAREWRLAATAGMDGRRARQTLRDDLEVLEENAQGYAGPLKVQVAGPWTLAASLFLPLGGRVLGDRGARRDVAQALADGAAGLVADVSRRLPDVEVVLQVDEPSLPAVLAGGVPTEGGYFRHRAVADAEVAEHLAPLAALTPGALVHSCAPDVPVDLLTASTDGAGFAGLSLDAAQVGGGTLDALAAAVADGTALYWGVLDPRDADPHPDPLVARTLAALRPLELGATLADRLWLTPACGQAGARASVVPRAFDALRRAADHVDDALRR